MGHTKCVAKSVHSQCRGPDSAFNGSRLVASSHMLLQADVNVQCTKLWNSRSETSSSLKWKHGDDCLHQSWVTLLKAMHLSWHFLCLLEGDLGVWHPASFLGPWAEPLPLSLEHIPGAVTSKRTRRLHGAASVFKEGGQDITSLSYLHHTDANLLTK